MNFKNTKYKSTDFNVYDIETYTLKCNNKQFSHLDAKGSSIQCSTHCQEGLQRAYYILVYNSSTVEYKHFRRCDYLTEIDYNKAIVRYFGNNSGIYFSFNGKNFDHLLLNRIFRLEGVAVKP